MRKRILGLLVIEFILCAGCVADALPSVCVVGGTDGPTAVFVASSKSDWRSIARKVLASVVAITALTLLFRRKK